MKDTEFNFEFNLQQNNSGNGVYTAFTGKDDVKKLLLMHEWRGER